MQPYRKDTFKPQTTFSDCLALVRCTIWAEGNDVNSLVYQDQVVISRPP